MLKLSWCRLLFLSWENLGYLINFRNVLIHGFECGSELGNVEGFTFGGDVGDVTSVCNLGGCITGSTIGSGVGVLVMFGG